MTTQEKQQRDLNNVKLKLTIISLDFLNVIFSGGGQFDPPSYLKKYYSNLNITLYNC